MKQYTRAVGRKNGGPGVLPCVRRTPLERWKHRSFLKYSGFFYCFLEVFVVSAQRRFGIGAFCFKTKDTSHPRGNERVKQSNIHTTMFLHAVQDDTCIAPLRFQLTYNTYLRKWWKQINRSSLDLHTAVSFSN